MVFDDICVMKPLVQESGRNSFRYARNADDDNDVRAFAMALIEKYGFGESYQEGIIYCDAGLRN